MGHLNSHAEAGSLSSGSHGHSTWRASYAKALCFPPLHVHSSSFFRARSMHIMAINGNEKSAIIQPLAGGMGPSSGLEQFPFPGTLLAEAGVGVFRLSLYLPHLTELITTRPHCPPPTPGSGPVVCSPSKTRANVHVLIRGCRSPSQKTSGTLPPFPFLCKEPLRVTALGTSRVPKVSLWPFLHDVERVPLGAGDKEVIPRNDKYRMQGSTPQFRMQGGIAS